MLCSWQLVDLELLKYYQFAKDLDLDAKPAKVFVRGEYTKTKADRVVFLTEEIAQQSISWLTYKYRKMRVCYNGWKNKLFAMRHPNEMVQMDILGPFYLGNSSQRNYYIISCLDDCSRKVASRWSKRKRSVDVLNVLEDWIVIINGKPEKIMHDNGKQFTSKMFRHFLVHNQIKDKQIPNSFLPTATRENRSI